MVPAWLFLLPVGDIATIAEQHKLDPRIIVAIVKKESNGQTCATRYEPHFRWLPFHNVMDDYGRNIGITMDTVKTHMKTSWGLMQVMGVVAYEEGFRGHFVDLCKPRVGLEYGCRKFKKLLDRYGNIPDAVSAYNQGSPKKNKGGLYLNEKSYVDPVLAYYRELVD